ncbi:MAG: phage portal protein [Bacillota bacterium]
MSNLRVTPKQSLLRRLTRAVGEISMLRNAWPSGWGFQYMSPYRLDSSRVDYALTRELYRNINDRYKLGAAFARPIVDTAAGFMGAPHFDHLDPEAAQALEKDVDRWTGKILRINRNAVRDGDQFARIVRAPSRFDPRKKEEFRLQLIPPEWCTPVPDPVTGGWQQLVIRYPAKASDDQGRVIAEYTIMETLTPTTRKVETDGRAPADVRTRLQVDEANPWGFIPVVHFKNEDEETQLFGFSDLEPVEPFMKAYHDTMLFAVQGSKYFSRPKVKFSLKDVKAFLANNFSPEEVASGKLKFADKEIFMMQDGDDANFISADSGLVGITTLLQFLFYCIVDVSQTPEFAFGTAVSSSKASVSEQMVPLSRKIRRKRGLFEEPYGELAGMYLAMWSKVNNRVLGTYQVDVGWDELSPKNDKEVADTIFALSQGLSLAVESNVMSVDAASDFMREFVPSMLPWVDPEGDDDERRRVARTMLWRKRIEDGQGFEAGDEDGGEGPQTGDQTPPPAGD